MAQNRAESYGVQIQELGNQNQPHWSAELVTHLTPVENRGKQHVFVDVFDENNTRVHDSRLRIGWTWEGRQQNQDAPPKPLDKPGGDFGHGNVDMYPSQTLTIWIEGDGLLSDSVVGFHTRHPDELGPNGEKWNSYGHHSFYVRFERLSGAVVVPPVEPPIEPPSSDLGERVSALEAVVTQHERTISALTRLLAQQAALLNTWGDK